MKAAGSGGPQVNAPPVTIVRVRNFTTLREEAASLKLSEGDGGTGQWETMSSETERIREGAFLRGGNYVSGIDGDVQTRQEWPDS